MFNFKNSKLIALTLVILIALIALCGCGEQRAINYAKDSATNEEIIERNTEYLSEYPEGKYAEEARVQLDLAYIEVARECMEMNDAINAYKGYLEQCPEGRFVDEALIALAAMDNIVNEAAVYDSKESGPFKLFIIEHELQFTANPNKNNKNLFRYHEWNDMLPASLAASTLDDASLYVVVQEEYNENGTYQYTGGKTLTTYRRDLFIYIVNAKTGEILKADMIIGGTAEIPTVITDGDWTSSGMPVSYESFKDWLDDTFQELSTVE